MKETKEELQKRLLIAEYDKFMQEQNVLNSGKREDEYKSIKEMIRPKPKKSNAITKSDLIDLIEIAYSKGSRDEISGNSTTLSDIYKYWKNKL